MTADHAPDDPRKIDSLEVHLRLTPAATVTCPIVEADRDLEAARINAVGETCRVELTPSDGAGAERATGTVHDECFCRVFADAECVPAVERVENGTIHIRTSVDRRETVRELVAGLRDTVGRVELDRLAIVDGTDGASGVGVGDVSLTAKQREALELAVRRGYFEDEVALGTLADDLGISKSALSQRLRGAQAKLARGAVDT